MALSTRETHLPQAETNQLTLSEVFRQFVVGVLEIIHRKLDGTELSREQALKNAQLLAEQNERFRRGFR